MPPDPKQGKRVVDPQALRTARLMWDECAACGDPPANAHHVIQRGAPYFGDDVIANIVLLCGSGTMRCHGAWHGSPYVVSVRSTFPFEEGRIVEARRDAEWVGRRIGVYIEENRPDTVAYVLGKLGDIPGREYLRRHYYLEV